VTVSRVVFKGSIVQWTNLESRRVDVMKLSHSYSLGFVPAMVERTVTGMKWTTTRANTKCHCMSSTTAHVVRNHQQVWYGEGCPLSSGLPGLVERTS